MSEATRLRLEEIWKCGPGEMVTDVAPDPYSGEPMQIAVGQMCASDQHAHAWWNGACEFAHHTSEALADVTDPCVKAQESPTNAGVLP